VKRTGFTVLTQLTVKICVLLSVWKPKIIAYVTQADYISSQDKVAIIDSINAIENACSAYRAVITVLER